MVLFLTYFGYSVVCLAVGLAVYTLITPVKEWALVREGNVAAACSLGGAAIGLSLPIASLSVHSVSLLDMASWSGIAIVSCSNSEITSGSCIAWSTSVSRSSRDS